MIGTKFNYYDLSAINEIEDINVNPDTAPVVLTCGATAKGTEDLVEISGRDFRSQFGAPDFARFGQSSIQNQRMAAAGAKLVFQRLVADDAKLGNIIVSAKVYQTNGPKVNAQGQPLYTTTTGEETTEAAGNTPINVDTCHIFYKTQSVADCADINAVIEAAKTTYNATGVEETVEITEEGVETKKTVYTYPLFLVTDNGRGVSNKRFAIVPENSLSKNLSFMYYTINFFEDGNIIDSTRFSAIPSKLYSGRCIDFETAAKDLTQAKGTMIEEYADEFIKKVCEFSGYEYEEFIKQDILFGTTRKGTEALEGVVVDTVFGQDIKNTAGISLANGNNGNFTDAPAKNAKTELELKEFAFFNGDITEEIWNLDTFQIDTCYDANYPVVVKEKIATLAEYRKDFVYYRDYGTEIYSKEDVIKMKEKLTPSTYVTDFCQAYDVRDPYSHKQATVTITYSIASMMVNHLKERRHCPFAGQRYAAVITDIIDKKTLHYAPKVIPNINEKEDLEDLKVNYASYFKDMFIIESLYTSQPAYTQMSFSNNVMAVQQVVKALRVKFPAVRYQYITKESDLAVYEKEVNDCLSLYSANFAELRYQYISDKQYRENKIFRAALYFRFNEFVQGELIDAYMLPTEV